MPSSYLLSPSSGRGREGGVNINVLPVLTTAIRLKPELGIASTAGVERILQTVAIFDEQFDYIATVLKET
jgi:hypothetical protein